VPAVPDRPKPSVRIRFTDGEPRRRLCIEQWSHVISCLTRRSASGGRAR
jgi:hypothetical protein